MAVTAAGRGERSAVAVISAVAAVSSAAPRTARCGSWPSATTDSRGWSAARPASAAATAPRSARPSAGPRVRCGCSTRRSAGRSPGCCRSPWCPWSSPRAALAGPRRGRRRAGRCGVAGWSRGRGLFLHRRHLPRVLHRRAGGGDRGPRRRGAGHGRRPGPVRPAGRGGGDGRARLRPARPDAGLAAVAAVHRARCRRGLLRAARVAAAIGLAAVVAGPAAFVAGTAVRSGSVLESADSVAGPPSRRSAVVSASTPRRRPRSSRGGSRPGSCGSCCCRRCSSASPAPGRDGAPRRRRPRRAS